MRTSRFLIILSMVSMLCSWQNIAALAKSMDTATAEVFQRNGIQVVASEADLDPKSRGNRSFTFKPTENIPDGKAYVIVTDQTDPDCLKSLTKLAQFHSGSIIQLKNFRNLSKIPGARAALVERLQAANPKYVAFAPRIENFSENAVLAVWQLLLKLGNGKITVYPAYLVAKDSQGLDALVTKSIVTAKLVARDLNPVVIAQATDQKAGGLRAVQKAEVMEDFFNEFGINCPGLVVRTYAAPPPMMFPKVAVLGTIEAPPTGFIQQIPPEATQALTAARMILLFGHGSPGMTCSLAVNAFSGIPMNNDIVLCGSCFSCTPMVSDIMQDSNGRRPESLLFRSIANGAQVFYGHMHENGGFPQLFVAFESLMKGETVGQSYQRVINAVLPSIRVPQPRIVMNDAELADPHEVDARNGLLLVMIGDPAACPIGRSE